MTELITHINIDGSKYTYDGKHLRLYGVTGELFAKINKYDTLCLKEFLNKIEDL